MNHTPQGLCICHHIGCRYAFNDIGSAVAHKDTDPWGFPPNIPLFGVGFFTHQRPTGPTQTLRGHSCRTAGHGDGIGDVHGPAENAAGINTGTVGFHWVKGGHAAEAFFTEGNTQPVSQCLVARWRCQTHGQHHQVKGFFPNLCAVHTVPQCNGIGFRVLAHNGGFCPLKSNPIKRLGPFIIPLKAFAECAYIIMKNHHLQGWDVFFGENHLFHGVHAAHG